MVICLERGADCLHMVQLMPLQPKTPSSLASFKSRLVLHFWYQLTQVVLEKEAIKWVCVHVSKYLCMCIRVFFCIGEIWVFFSLGNMMCQ